MMMDWLVRLCTSNLQQPPAAHAVDTTFAQHACKLWQCKDEALLSHDSWLQDHVCWVVLQLVLEEIQQQPAASAISQASLVLTLILTVTWSSCHDAQDTRGTRKLRRPGGEGQ